MSYFYSLPTTGAMSFVDFLQNVGPYSTEISDATAQRGRLRTVLKDLKRDSQETRDYRHILNVSQVVVSSRHVLIQFSVNFDI